MSDALLTRIAAAETLPDLDAVRVALLGKSGEITAKLKSLGSMDPETRAAEAPKVHAEREAVTAALAARKDALETAELDRKRAAAALGGFDADRAPIGNALGLRGFVTGARHGFALHSEPATELPQLRVQVLPFPDP